MRERGSEIERGRQSERERERERKIEREIDIYIYIERENKKTGSILHSTYGWKPYQTRGSKTPL